MADGTGEERPVKDDSGANRRSFYRVKARIPLRHRRVRPDEREDLEREILTPRPEPPDVEPPLAAWMQRLERKLDTVLSHLDDAVPAPLGELDLCQVELSASGMMFAAKETADVDGIELLEFLLPGIESRVVRALARVVVRCESGEPGEVPQVAFAFSTIDEEDREAIVRFGNEVQRIGLRARSAERERA